MLVLGISICLLATLKKLREEKLHEAIMAEKDTVPCLEAECRTGFKGV